MEPTAATLVWMFQRYASGQHSDATFMLPGDLSMVLDVQLQAAGSEGIAAHLQVLLDLADAVAAFSARMATEIEADLAGFTQRGARQLNLLRQAVTVNTTLLRYVLPACGGRDADVQRVLAAGAVLLTAGDVLAALAPSRLQPHPPDWQFQVMAFDGCLSNSLFSMAEALDSAHSLPPQLEAPATLLAWMRQAAAAMGEVRSARDLRESHSLDGLFLCLAALGKAHQRLPAHVAAVCADLALAADLALLTQQAYAALPAWRMREQAGELAWSKLLEWATAWPSLRWGGEQLAPATAARLASASAAVLQGEAERLPRLALPRTAKGALKWQRVLEAVASQVAFLAQPGMAGSRGSRGSSSGIDWRELFMAVVPTGAPVARFAAALAGGQPPAAALQGGGVGAALATALADWAKAVQQAGIKLSKSNSRAARYLRREAEQAAIDLGASLVHLTAGLPALAAALGPLSGMRVLQALEGTATAMRSCIYDEEDAFWSVSDDRMPPLMSACCKLTHALAGWSAADLQAAGLAAAANGQQLKAAGDGQQHAAANGQQLAVAADGEQRGGRLHANATAALSGALVHLIKVQILALACWAPHPDEPDDDDWHNDWDPPPETKAERAERWDTDMVCCLLQATAAIAATGMPRADIPATLEAASPYYWREAAAAAEQQPAAAAEKQPTAAVDRRQREDAVLRMLAGRLHGPAARQHLPALLQRLLPAEGSIDVSGDSDALPQAQRLPLEAELLQAHALDPERRQCANVRCPTLPSSGNPTDLQEGKGKRCGGCKTLRYCGTGCSHADWQAGHRRVCKQLAAERQAAKQAAAGQGGTQ